MNDTVILTAADYRKRIDGLIERGRFHQAREELGQALAGFPEDGDLLYQAARIDAQSGELARARDTLLQVLAHAPKHLNARYFLVSVHEDLKEPAKAEAILLDLLHDYPELGPLYARYAMLMYRNLHVDKAKALAREAMRLDPNDEQALIACMMGDLIDGNLGAQQSKLAELLHNHPEDHATARLLISHLLEQGKYWSARRIAVELLRAEPHSKDALALVVNIDALAHWTVLPLWPFNRWGVPATIVFFLGTMLGLTQLRKYLSPETMSIINISLLSYVVYSWIYPPLLTRWLKRRAGL